MIYDEGKTNGVSWKVEYHEDINQYVFTAGDEEATFSDTHQLDQFLDRLDSFTWSCCR
jgi:hypothetical protein